MNDILPPAVQFGFILVSLLYLSIVLAYVRKGSLKLQYALIWILTALISLLLALFPVVLKVATSLVGIETPSNLLFTVSILLLVLVMLRMSVNLSIVAEQNRRLVQEVTILRGEMEDRAAGR